MNYVFISPNFPESYKNFARCLKENGVTVLGIGDAPYEGLDPDLRASLQEYYYVPDMTDYDAMYRAVAWYAHKYGKIGWIESNNEYWLEQDAMLRTDFNVVTGPGINEIGNWRSKSAMKEFYQKAGIPAAQWILKDTLENALAFAKRVGYPVIVKPDRGVGASFTYKVHDEEEMQSFFEEALDVPYVIEQFIEGEVTTYDGVADMDGNVLFAASHVTPTSIMDMVNEQKPCCYYVNKAVPAEVEAAGKKTLKAFGVRGRCFHLEFFRLLKDYEGLGKTGDIIGLEVNMRPAGGFTPDMLNYSQSADMFQIYADMVAFGEVRHEYTGPHYYTMYIGRRDHSEYNLSLNLVRKKYESCIRIDKRMPDAIATAMGNDGLVACFSTLEEMNDYMQRVLSPVPVEPVREW